MSWKVLHSVPEPPISLYIPIHTVSAFSSHNILLHLLLQHLIVFFLTFALSSMKRQIESQNTESLDLAISLMLLSQQTPQHKSLKISSSIPHHEFECKTCNRKFSSFQALGGHRASHKKPRFDSQAELQKPHSEKSLHECSICGQRFSLGQALGGHMRKHRAAMNEASASMKDLVSEVPVLKRSNSSKRVVCLDLNLTPLENDLKLLFGNRAPSVNLSLC